MPRFRFSIRFLVMAFLLVAMMFGYWHHVAEQKRRLAASITSKGGSVYWPETPNNRLLAMFSKLLPREYWSEPLSVEAVNITDNELVLVARHYTNVESIRLQDSLLTFDGITHLAKLQSLSQLAILGDVCPDLTNLHLCKQLTKLDIDIPRFNAEHVAKLKGLTSLDLLMLFRSRLTSDDLKPLTTSVPDCEISVFPRSSDDGEQFASVSYSAESKQFTETDAESTGGPPVQFLVPPVQSK